MVLAGLPPDFRVRPIADQSLFVRASINGVVREAVIAACLTGLMILIFSGELAQHADHRCLDSAFDSDLHHHPQRHRADHQHHDAGRAGAGRGNSGG